MPTQLRIPPDFPLGALFGKGGSRIKDVSSRCGARISVDGDRLLISFTGAGAAAAAAEYAEQLAEHREAVICAYPHPSEAFILVNDALAAGSAFEAARHGAHACMHARRGRRRRARPLLALPARWPPHPVPPVADEVAAAAERREALYVLRPAQSGYARASSGGESDDDGVSGLVASLSAGMRLSASGPFAGPATAPGLVSRLVEALHEAQAFSPSFDQVKLRFNFGAQAGRGLQLGPTGARAPSDRPHPRSAGLQAAHPPSMTSPPFRRPPVLLPAQGQVGHAQGERRSRRAAPARPVRADY